MQPVIDMRMTVPYRSFCRTPHFAGYNTEASRRARRNLRVQDAASAKECSMELLLEEMKEADIRQACTFNRSTIPGTDPDDITALLREYPDKFIGVPHIDVSDTAKALQNIRKYVIDGPCTAIYIEPGIRFSRVVMHGNDERLFPVYELCQEHRIPILMQYGGGVNTLKYYTPSDIDDIVGIFPKLRLAITHGGWPQVMSFCQLAYKHEYVYLVPDYYFTKFPGSHEYVQAANYILQDKIMFGSLYPATSVGEAVNNYLNAGLYEDVIPKVMHDNAARLLGLVADSDFFFANGHNAITNM